MSEKPTDPAPAPSGGGHPVVDALRIIVALPLYKSAVLGLLALGAWLIHSNGDEIQRAVVAEIRRPASPAPDEVHARALTEAVTRSAEMNRILREAMVVSEAARGELWQYHNGVSSLVGIPFFKLSQTNVVAAPAVSPMSVGQSSLPLHVIDGWLPRFLAGQCVDQDDDAASPPLAQLMRDGSVERIIACPVHISGLREPVGHVAISYVRGWSPPDRDAAMSSLRAAAVRAGAVLAAYRESMQR